MPRELTLRRCAIVSLLATALLFGCAQSTFSPTDRPAQRAAPATVKIGAVTLEPERVADGLWWARQQFDDLYDSRQSVNILRAEVAEHDVQVALINADGREKTSALGERSGAAAAVNGTFFVVRGDNAGQSVCFLKIDGELIAENNAKIGNAGLGIERDGEVVIIRRAPDAWRADDTPHSVVASGPLLIWEGEPVDIGGSPSFSDRRHPRTAAGLLADGTVILITVDGRHEQAAGMSLPELQQLMLDLGCEHALNLDGGGSTTMWIDGRGVVNYPSDNKQFDHAGERAVGDAILLHAPSMN